MNQDEDHLKMLAILHYVYGGISGLFACIPIIHVGIGLALILAPDQVFDKQPPPAFVGWIVVIFGSLIILAGWTFAALSIAAGRCLAHRKRLTFCYVIAGIECIFVPIGTLLGVFTIIVLQRPSVSALFTGQNADSPADLSNQF